MKKIMRSNHWIHLMNLLKNLNRVFSVLQLIRSGDSRHHNVCIFDCLYVWHKWLIHWWILINLFNEFINSKIMKKEFKWIQIINLNEFQMNSHNEFKWIQMNSNEFKWIQMNSNDEFK